MRLFALVVVAGLLAGAAFDDKAELGKPVPKCALKTADGKEVCLEDFKKTDDKEGKIVAIVFWSYKCPSGLGLMKQEAKFAEFCKEKGVEFIGICSYGESAEEVGAYSTKNEIKYSLLVDEKCKAADIFSAMTVTTAYLIDKDGNLRYRGAFQGNRKSQPPKAGLKDALEELLAGKEVSVKETQAGG